MSSEHYLTHSIWEILIASLKHIKAFVNEWKHEHPNTFLANKKVHDLEQIQAYFHPVAIREWVCTLLCELFSVYSAVSCSSASQNHHLFQECKYLEVIFCPGTHDHWPLAFSIFMSTSYLFFIAFISNVNCYTWLSCLGKSKLNIYVFRFCILYLMFLAVTWQLNRWPCHSLSEWVTHFCFCWH